MSLLLLGDGLVTDEDNLRRISRAIVLMPICMQYRG
jgi:hypothetical protein